MVHSSPIAGRTTIIEKKRIELKTLREFSDIEPFKRENHVLSENFDSNLEKRAITFMYYLELSPFLDIFDYVSSNNSEEYSDEIAPDKLIHSTLGRSSTENIFPIFKNSQ